MQNYFNYFTEIEEHFQRRRGSLLLLSTLDWALIETWRDAGIALEVVLRGIDQAFDKHDARQRRGPQRRVNGLAWCAQAVIEAAEQQREAAIGTSPAPTPVASDPNSGFEAQRIADHLETNAQALDSASIALEHREPELSHWAAALAALALRLRHLAEAVVAPPETADTLDPAHHFHVRDASLRNLNLEELERQLTVLEEKLFATLTTHAPEELLVRFKSDAARELASYRSRMSAVQLRQIEQQFVHKRLLEHYQIPRLSLFYMRQA